MCRKARFEARDRNLVALVEVTHQVVTRHSRRLPRTGTYARFEAPKISGSN